MKSERIESSQSGKSQLLHNRRQNSASGTQKAIRGKKKSQFFLLREPVCLVSAVEKGIMNVTLHAVN